MEKTTAPAITRFVEISPDTLLDLGHRIKAAAMDGCYPGQSVTMSLNAEITLVYHPSKEFCKPLHVLGDSSPRVGEFPSVRWEDETNSLLS